MTPRERARNPETPPEELFNLAVRYPQEVAANEALDLWVLADPAWGEAMLALLLVLASTRRARIFFEVHSYIPHHTTPITELITNVYQGPTAMAPQILHTELAEMIALHLVVEPAPRRYALSPRSVAAWNRLNVPAFEALDRFAMRGER